MKGFQLNVSLRTLTIVAATTLAACAEAPENIAATPMPASMYAGITCTQARTERAVVGAEVESLEARQRNAQSGDAMGVFLIGLPMSSMSGNDVAAELSIAKGKAAALDIHLARC